MYNEGRTVMLGRSDNKGQVFDDFGRMQGRNMRTLKRQDNRAWRKAAGVR